MPYICIWIHLVWTTKNRAPLMTDNIREKIFGHIRANAREKKIHVNCLNGCAEHVHALISLGADQTISKIAQLLKGESSYWVNDNRLIPEDFGWQDDYFAVSVSESGVDAVRNYILCQEEHHKKKSFDDEYDEFIRKYKFRKL